MWIEDEEILFNDVVEFSVSPSLEEKIGAMLLIGFKGTDPLEPSVQEILLHIKSGQCGGVVLYGYNIEYPEQLKTLTQAFHDTQKSPFIALDQEGGKVQRLTIGKNFIGTPSAHKIAQEYSPEEAKNIYKHMAKELDDHGINLNFGPVVDITSHEKPCSVIGGYERSYGETSEKAILYANSFIDAHHDEKIMTALKHFPGHGLAMGDSHHGLVDVTDTVQPIELEPFYALIEQGKTDMIMTAHVMNRNIDEDYPITLSPIALKKLLRNKGYDGVIITDDLMMGAITQYYGFKEAIIAAIQAENDMLIFSGHHILCKDKAKCDVDLYFIIDTIKDAIKEEIISEERITVSYNRIIKLKEKYKTI